MTAGRRLLNARPGPGPAPRRLRTQLASAVLANSGLAGQRLFPGLKACSYPFLNCYACPLAIGACPVGTIQHFVIIRRAPLLVVGLLGVIGSIWGRMSCAWLCPFGLVQDLLHRLPWPRRKPRVSTRRWSWVKYVVLGVLFLVIPYVTLEPWFCKLCPAGTLEAGLPWLALSAPLRDLAGRLFWVKLAILAVLVLASILLSRPFCRFACPLGATYGLANRWSRVQIIVDRDKCTGCGKCDESCPMGLKPYRDLASTDCIRCEECVDSCEHLKVTSPRLLPWPRRPAQAQESVARAGNQGRSEGASG